MSGFECHRAVCPKYSEKSMAVNLLGALEIPDHGRRAEKSLQRRRQ